MLKSQIAQGLFRIISTMNHLCRAAVNCWVFHNAFKGHALLAASDGFQAPLVAIHL